MATIACYEMKVEEQALYKKALNKNKIIFIAEPLSEKNLIPEADILSVFIYSKVTADLIAKMPKLTLITTRSTGFDHIDTAAAKARNITVCNVPFYGENTVAEHGFALLLALTRNIHLSVVRNKANNFSLDGLTGTDLRGKIMGIVGGGHIGMHMARMAKGFGMEVIVYDVVFQEFLSDTIGFRYVSLEELYATADVISFHVPYNKFTHHLLNMKNIKKVKKGAIIINTARGGVIETDALLYGLEKKIISAAGLDVLEGEEAIINGKPADPRITQMNKTILSMPNVIFTPHNSFNSKEALLRILTTSIDNVKNAQAGKPTNVIKS